MSPSRRRLLLLIALLVLVVNLPLVHSAWTARKVERSGVDVVGSVTDDRAVDGEQFWIEFTLPEDLDPEQEPRRAEVDEEAYDDAVATGEVMVRVLEDDLSAYRVEGAVESRAPLVATLFADAVLLVVVLLLWQYGGRRRTELHAVALEDVRRCPPDASLERLDGEVYLIRGEVLDRAEDRMVLDLGNRTVVVQLDGHANPVGYQQPAQVRARMVT